MCYNREVARSSETYKVRYLAERWSVPERFGAEVAPAPGFPML
jgi:hypothetical protein